jgi:uncharacterized membrane-anchored protein
MTENRWEQVVRLAALLPDNNKDNPTSQAKALLALPTEFKEIEKAKGWDVDELFDFVREVVDLVNKRPSDPFEGIVGVPHGE